MDAPTGLPAGSLVPAIVAGAAFGRVAGKAFIAGIQLGPRGIDKSTYALLGAAALLAGLARSTVSISRLPLVSGERNQRFLQVAVCVILLEVTNNLHLLPMIMLVILVAKVGLSQSCRARHARCHSERTIGSGTVGVLHKDMSVLCFAANSHAVYCRHDRCSRNLRDRHGCSASPFPRPQAQGALPPHGTFSRAAVVPHTQRAGAVSDPSS